MEPVTERPDPSARWRLLSLVLLVVAIGLLLLLLRRRPEPAAPLHTPPPTDVRNTVLEKYHAPDETEKSIRAGLVWLTEHQDAAGTWGAQAKPCPASDECGGIVAKKEYVDGLTGLAVIAYLVRGEFTPSNDPERKAWDERFHAATTKGIDALAARQAEDGSWSEGHMYSTAIGLLALVEASARASRKDLGPRIEKAIDFVARSQSKGGGWDYYGCGSKKGNTDRSDTSIVAWTCMALATADEVGYPVPEAAFAGIVRHLHAVTDPKTQFVGYVSRGSDQSFTCLAIGLLSRLFLGYDPRAGPLRRQAKAVLAGAVRSDTYFWYHGSMGMFQVTDLFPIWSRTVQQTLVGQQARAGHAAGSWAPSSGIDSKGGRVLATELGLLSLEVYFRHAILDEVPAAKFAGPRAVVRALPTVEDAKVRAALLEELGLMRSDDAVLACLSEHAERDPDGAAKAAAKSSLEAIRARAAGPVVVEEQEFKVDSRHEWTAAPFDLVPGETFELTVEGDPGVPLVARLGPAQVPFAVAGTYQGTADRFGRLFLGPGDGAATPKRGEWRVKATVRFAR